MKERSEQRGPDVGTLEIPPRGTVIGEGEERKREDICWKYDQRIKRVTVL
jgi:hypothetical protein